MKKLLYITGLLQMGIFAAQSTTENYIYSRSYLDAATAPNSTTKQVQSITYFDGLGRPKQSIAIKATPKGNDLVTPVEYDGFGRQTKEWLPLPQGSTSSGNIYPTPATTGGDITTAYGSSSNLYSEKQLEASPLDRVFQQAHPGSDWALGSGHTVNFDYQTNTYSTTATADNVRYYIATTAWNSANGRYDETPAISSAGYYPANTLYKNQVTDEDGNITYEYKNGKGQTLLIRKNDGTTNLDTYYVYDDLDHLAYVIPPKAAVIFNTNNAIDTATLDNLCYQYRYDHLNRLVEKKLPGKGGSNSLWELMVYDKQDRLVLTQDPNQRGKQWTFTKYDRYGRVVYTGLFANTSSRMAMQSALNNMSANPYNNETRSDGGFTQNGITVYYTKSAFPTGSMTLLSVNYYDTYPSDLPTGVSIPTDVLGQTTLRDNTSASSVTRTTQGLPTASYVKNIEDDNWTKTYTWYDTKARAIGSYTRNHLGGYTKTETLLDFAGVPQNTNTYQQRTPNDISVMVKERFVYDGQNRLLKHYHQVDGNPEELLAENTYNEIGQLITKKVGGNNVNTTPVQTLTYAYNVRGWLSKVNDPANLGSNLFAMKIKYNDPANNLIVSPKYNGNISEIDWKTADANLLKRYSYTYDKVNRLTFGRYQEPTTTLPYNDFFNERLTYDDNGNITTLSRTKKPLIGNTAEVSDNLSYIYNGNQLLKISDASQNDNGYPYKVAPSTITYDNNGNMISFLDKNISGIGYNFLNLPNVTTLTDSYNLNGVIKHNRMVNLYRADGTKLRSNFYYSSSQMLYNPTTNSFSPQTMEIQDIREFLDGIEYANENATDVPEPLGLVRIPTAEGYFDYKHKYYVYQYKDHLGNVRVNYYWDKIQKQLAIIDINNYYPFGMNFSDDFLIGNNSADTHRYNGKEYISPLNMYDYGARMYMPDIGRWGVVDPLAEKLRRHTPYNYAVNNPIVNVDPDGMLSQSFIDEMMKKSTGEKTTWTNNGNGNFSDGKGNNVSDNNPPYYRILMFGGANLDPTGSTSYGQLSSSTKYIAHNIKKDNTTVSYDNWPKWVTSKTRQAIVDGWANTLQEAYNNGDKIILYGYSRGGVAVLDVQRALAKRGVPVEMLITVDAANGPQSDEINTYVHWNVKQVFNFYQTEEHIGSLTSHGSPLMASPRNSTIVENINDTGQVFYPPGQTNSSTVNHTNIDEFRRDTVINLINQHTQHK